MKAFTKKLLVLCTLLFLALGLGLFAACNDQGKDPPDDGKVTYTVTVTVSGGTLSELPFTPTVLLTDADDDNVTYTQEVNADGVASFRIPEGAYIYELADLSEGYSSTFGEFKKGGSREGTLTLTLTVSTVRLRLNYGDVGENFLERLEGDGWKLSVQLSRAGRAIGNPVAVEYQAPVGFEKGYYYATVSASTGIYSVDYYLTLYDGNDVVREYKGSTYSGADSDGEIEISPTTAQSPGLLPTLYPCFNVVAQQVPASQPQAPTGTAFVNYPLDGSAGQVFVPDSAHILHIGSVDGPVLYAAAGKASRLFGEDSFLAESSEVPHGAWEFLDNGATSSTRGLLFSYYWEFIQPYVASCGKNVNSPMYGLTAVTEELYALLCRKAAALGGFATFESVPEECYGLIPCGYFSPVTPNSGVAVSGEKGTAANPYALRPFVGTFSITIPAGSDGVYYAIETTEPKQITSSDAKAKITYSAFGEDKNASGAFTVITADKVTATTWDGAAIVFLLGSTDTAATTFEITVSSAPGSKTNPYTFGSFSETSTSLTKTISLTETDLSMSEHGAYYRVNVFEMGTYVFWSTDANAKLTLPDGATSYGGGEGFAFLYDFTQSSAIFTFGTVNGAAASYTVYAARVFSPFAVHGVLSGEGTAADPHEIGIGAYFSNNINTVYVAPATGTHYVLNPKFTGTYTFTVADAPAGLQVNGSPVTGNTFTVEATAGTPVDIVFTADTAAVFTVTVTVVSSQIADPMAGSGAGTEGAPYVLSEYNHFTIPKERSEAGVWFAYAVPTDGAYQVTLVTTTTAGGAIGGDSRARVTYNNRSFGSGNPLTFEAILHAGDTAVFRLTWNLPVSDETPAGVIYADMFSIVRTGPIPDYSEIGLHLGEDTEIDEICDGAEFYFQAPAAGYYVVRSIGTESVFLNENLWGAPSYYGVGGYIFHSDAGGVTTFYVTNSKTASIRVDTLDSLKADAQTLTAGSKKTTTSWTTFTFTKDKWNNAGVLVKLTVTKNTDIATCVDAKGLKVDGNTVAGLYMKAVALIGNHVVSNPFDTTQFSQTLVSATMPVSSEVYILLSLTENVEVTASVSLQLRAYPYSD